MQLIFTSGLINRLWINLSRVRQNCMELCVLYSTCIVHEPIIPNKTSSPYKVYVLYLNHFVGTPYSMLTNKPKCHWPTIIHQLIYGAQMHVCVICDLKDLIFFENSQIPISYISHLFISWFADFLIVLFDRIKKQQVFNNKFYILLFVLINCYED